jgi:hypothetical protein
VFAELQRQDHKMQREYQEQIDTMLVFVRQAYSPLTACPHLLSLGRVILGGADGFRHRIISFLATQLSNADPKKRYPREYRVVSEPRAQSSVGALRYSHQRVDQSIHVCSEPTFAGVL